MIGARADTATLGREGEAAARAHLERSGLRFVRANYRCRGGEIDLIMRDRHETVFVEVRRRASGSTFGDGIDSVTATKRRRLVRAALHYLQRHGEQPCRFDVVGLDERLQARWIRDAFRADD